MSIHNNGTHRTPAQTHAELESVLSQNHHQKTAQDLTGVIDPEITALNKKNLRNPIPIPSPRESGSQQNKA